MDDAAWDHYWARTFGMLLGGDALDDFDRETGEPLTDDTLLVLINGHHEPVSYTLPQLEGCVWDVLVDTQNPCIGETEPLRLQPGKRYQLTERSIALLRWVEESERSANPALPPVIERRRSAAADTRNES
jgi:isoamylase